MAEMETSTCLLGKDPMQDQGCSRIQCKTCGWNPAVQDQRNALLVAGGMKLCDDGLARLVLAQADEKTEYAVPVNEDSCPICGKAFIKHRIDQKCCSTECGRKLGAITANEKRKQKST